MNGKNSDTPRTDALKSTPMTRLDSDNFARQLERELADANDQLDGIDEKLNELYWRKQYEQACIKIATQHDESVSLEARCKQLQNGIQRAIWRLEAASILIGSRNDHADDLRALLQPANTHPSQTQEKKP